MLGYGGMASAFQVGIKIGEPYQLAIRTTTDVKWTAKFAFHAKIENLERKFFADECFDKSDATTFNVHDISWIQCDRCDKWRIVRPEVAWNFSGEADFSCDMLRRTSCDAPEDKEEDFKEILREPEEFDTTDGDELNPEPEIIEMLDLAAQTQHAQ